MSLTLYRVADDYIEALDALADSGCSPEAIASTLEDLHDAVEDKARQVGAYILNLQAEIAAVIDAEERIAERRKSLTAQRNALTDYLKRNMETCDIREITAEDSTFAIRIRQNPESVELDDALPDLSPEYWREKTTREPNKIAILAALKAGKAVHGARLMRGTRLEIK